MQNVESELKRLQSSLFKVAAELKSVWWLQNMLGIASKNFEKKEGKSLSTNHSVV